MCQGDPAPPISPSAAGQPDRVSATPDSDNGDSASASNDLVFQVLHGSASYVSTTDSKDLVYQDLQESGYMVWVAAEHEAAPPTDDSPVAFLTLGEYLQALETAGTGDAATGGETSLETFPLGHDPSSEQDEPSAPLRLAPMATSLATDTPPYADTAIAQASD